MEEHNNSQDQMKMFLIFLVVVLVGVIGYLAFSKTSDDVETVDDTNTPTVTDETDTDDISENETPDTDEEIDEDTDVPTDSSVEEDEEPPQSAPEEAVIPDGWKEIENTTYGYTAYRPSSYYYKFFGSASLVGIDPNPIPDASSYAGAVTIQALSGDLETAMADYYSSFMAIMDTTEDHGNGTWSLIEAEIPEGDMFAAQNVMCAFIEVDGQVFVVDYRYEASGTAAYEDIFNQFYPAIQFDN